MTTKPKPKGLHQASCERFLEALFTTWILVMEGKERPLKADKERARYVARAALDAFYSSGKGHVSD